MQIDGINFAQAWFDLLSVLFEARQTQPRGLASREELGVSLRVGNLLHNVFYHPDRSLNYRFMVAEWLWIWFGFEEAGVLGRYNSQVLKFASNGKFDGAYGPRLKPQWDYLMKTLKRDPASRQAVATIWTPNPAPSKDIPCTVAYQLLLRDDKLHGIVTMRSSDVWLGLPYDFFTFSMLTNTVAATLGVDTGSLTFQLGSSHLYETDRERAKVLLKNRVALRAFASPKFTEVPPSWLSYQLCQPIDIKVGDSVYPDPKVIAEEPWGRFAQILSLPRERAFDLLTR